MIPPAVLKPPFDVTRASHVVLHVADLARSHAFYVDVLGLLATDGDDDTLWLRGLEEACHHSLVLKRGPAPVCERVGFRAFTEDDLDGVARHFADAGLPVAWADVEHQTRTLRTRDPAGTPLEFCVSMTVMPRAVRSFGLHLGACPMRLDHFQVLTPLVTESCAFYGGMGFRTSEYIVDVPPGAAGEEVKAVFLQRKGNPHDIVFMRSPGPRFHHVAFTSPEAHHLTDVCDKLASAGFGRSVEHGPGRHFGPGYARFLYLRDPDGHRIELFNNHYQTIDLEDAPLRWTPPEGGPDGRWGPMGPKSWQDEATAFAG